MLTEHRSRADGRITALQQCFPTTETSDRGKEGGKKGWGQKKAVNLVSRATILYKIFVLLYLSHNNLVSVEVEAIHVDVIPGRQLVPEINPGCSLWRKDEGRRSAGVKWVDRGVSRRGEMGALLVSLAASPYRLLFG